MSLIFYWMQIRSNWHFQTKAVIGCLSRNFVDILLSCLLTYLYFVPQTQLSRSNLPTELLLIKFAVILVFRNVPLFFLKVFLRSLLQAWNLLGVPLKLGTTLWFEGRKWMFRIKCDWKLHFKSISSTMYFWTVKLLSTIRGPECLFSQYGCVVYFYKLKRNAFR